MTIVRWPTDFHIFMDVYILKHPEAVPFILLHLDKGLANASWAVAVNFYNRTFRAHKQVQPL